MIVNLLTLLFVMKISYVSYLFLMAVVSLLAGCANLDKINDFATSAEKGAAGFETLPVSFKSLCLDDCKEQDIDAGKLHSTRCGCDLERQADSVDYLLYKTIADYFDGLQKLSADQTTSYNFNGLSTQLQGLKVPSATADAYSKLGSILAKAITDGYRRDKLKSYISEANPPLQVILTYLRSDIGTSLAIRLNTNKSKFESDYFSMVKTSNDNEFEKRKIIEEFYAQNTIFENQLNELQAYAKLLQTIADGHQKLTDNLDKLDKDGLKAMLSQYVGNIKDIRTQVQILKK